MKNLSVLFVLLLSSFSWAENSAPVTPKDMNCGLLTNEALHSRLSGKDNYQVALYNYYMLGAWSSYQITLESMGSVDAEFIKQKYENSKMRLGIDPHDKSANDKIDEMAKEETEVWFKNKALVQAYADNCEARIYDLEYIKMYSDTSSCLTVTREEEESILLTSFLGVKNGELMAKTQSMSYETTNLYLAYAAGQNLGFGNISANAVATTFISSSPLMRMLETWFVTTQSSAMYLQYDVLGAKSPQAACFPKN